MKRVPFIFIGGSPRSGTTLLQRLLVAHPNISGGAEFGANTMIFKTYGWMRQQIEQGLLYHFVNN